MMSTGRSRIAFTATQWQELEHQALIFKYMVSGVPVPSDLLYTIRRSLDTSLSSKLILHQPQHIGWSCFQMGYGRKIDPDPGRCRRTDGKKWRCSKEAYADSKYCERHMHRGRNRSRKPVEVMTTTTTTTASSIAPLTANNNTSTRPTPTAIPMSLNTEDSERTSFGSISDSISSLPFAYPHSSSSRHIGFDISSQDNNNNNNYNFVLDSSHYPHGGKNYSNTYGGRGMKEVGEHTFLSEVSGTIKSMSSSSMDDSWRLTMGQSYSQLHGLDDISRQQERKYQHYYYAPRSDNVKSDSDHQPPKKVMHHFFDDEWPPKDKDSWLDSEDKLSVNDLSLSKTHLSISIPNPSHDFFTSQSDK